MHASKMFNLEGKVALVTGGSHGIGFAIGKAFAEAGAKVAYCCSQESSLEKGKANYTNAEINAKGFICNITDEARVKQMVAEIASELGPIDILVNNAGIIKRGATHEMSVEDFRQVIDVDLTSQFIVAKAVIPSMLERGGGKIINIGSVLSEIGRDGVAAYNAAKGGLKLLTRSLSAEYGGRNIQVNAIGPGFVETELTAAIRAPQADGTPHPLYTMVINKAPAARWGKPEDIAGPALFLASPAASYVSGHMLYVDGGLITSFGK
ncbi:MAG: gluconate 5-dehydrogenase [Defluviitaleaceae bacterium]|nr:gluconate 5-dehydrogenase [Defluviitaleaceae bacterium]